MKSKVWKRTQVLCGLKNINTSPHRIPGARIQHRDGGGMNNKVREQRVNKLTALGRASKAMQGLITPGMAADTPAVRAKMAAKFPQRSLPVNITQGFLPPAAGVEVGDFIKAVGTFDSSAGAGPTGLRPQFVKELVGVGADDPCVQAVFDVSALFIQGWVPRFLRQW